MTDLIPEGFELNNTHRKYLGLEEVEPHWDKIQLNDSIVLYFDGDVVRKMINYSFKSYQETDHYEKTAENRTILLPITSRGKRKNLNYSATQSFRYQGPYFYLSENYIVIGNYTTQTSFYTEIYKNKLYIDDWLKKWVSETTEENFLQLQQFKNSKRVHQKYSEGDFFVFKIGRNKWGSEGFYSIFMKDVNQENLKTPTMVLPPF